MSERKHSHFGPKVNFSGDLKEIPPVRTSHIRIAADLTLSPQKPDIVKLWNAVDGLCRSAPQRVALQTSREGSCQTPQIKTRDPFLESLAQLGCPQAIFVGRGAAFEETPIAGQQNQSLVARDLRQKLVGAAIRYRVSNPGIRKGAAKRPVGIEYEPRIAERFGPQSR